MLTILQRTTHGHHSPHICTHTCITVNQSTVSVTLSHLCYNGWIFIVQVGSGRCQVYVAAVSVVRERIEAVTQHGEAGSLVSTGQ